MLFGDEFLGGGNVTGVVYINDFFKREGFQVKPGGNECALIVAHSRHTLLHALLKHAEGRSGQAVDASLSLIHI